MITPKSIENYCAEHSSQKSALFSELTNATKIYAPHAARMQVGPLEGAFLTLLTKLVQAKTVLEFGTFTGYSSLCFAEALPEGGKVTTLDRDPKATEVARKFWEKSTNPEKIELLVGDARETIKNLISEIINGSRPPFDIAFIDADKAGYETYYEASLKLVKKGGLIIADNVLWSGAVLNPVETSDHVIHAFNEKLKNDERIELVVLPIRDGMTLAMIK